MATLNFKGKTFVQNYHLTVPYHQLLPQKDKSLTDKVSLNDNLIIHGDNLKALKSLLPTYAGKVKCIYIDPPYNTGNESWAYNDNVNSPMIQEWLGKVVDKEDLTRHDKWLCMMMPRLRLLREFLKEDGVIFISIDDNEICHLRMLMDEIFGGESFVECFIWKSRLGKGATAQETAKLHEYVLCYAKDVKLFNFKTDKRFTSKITKERLRQWGQGDSREDRPTMYYPVFSKEFGEVYPKKPDGSDGRWRMSKEKIEELIENDLVVFEKQDDGRIEPYKIIPSGSETNTAFSSILDSEIVKTTAHGTIELKEIFTKQVMDYPKPTSLIKELLALNTYSDDDALILDSFSGSGTTGHAVLALNQEDGGNRKFILVECEDYADKITAERVRRVIKGVKDAKNEDLRNGLNGTFSFFDLGDPIEMESILEGKKLPSYEEFARYIFYTATGEEFDSKKINEKKRFIGETKEYEVYLFYKPDIEYLKSTALTLEVAKGFGSYKGKKRLVFAPSKYLDLNDSELIEKHGIKGIEYCQLPFEIYRMKG